MVPLFLEQRWVGVLVIVKADAARLYTQEEVELVKAVAAQTLLIIQCLLHLRQEVTGQTRALVQYEIHRLCDDFLTLASHELRTPLTVIKGNIQLARRRLATLTFLDVAKQPERTHKYIAQVLEQLGSATKNTMIQERVIDDLIEEVHLQVDQLTLSMKACDLPTLLKEAVSRNQQSTPEHKILLKIPSAVQELPIIADVERIRQVLNIYLTNALIYSPAEQPVIVELAVEDAVARVSIHDEGPGIPLEEQEHLWERFYCIKGSAVRSGFYLCKVLIEHHHGSVGVRSIRGYGTTFWFTLPIVASSEA